MTPFLLILGLILASGRRMISGAKNAAFYARVRKQEDVPDYILRWIRNLHRLESPAWYFQFGSVFCFLAAFALQEYDYLEAAGIALLGTMSASSFSSVFYQGFINNSVGRPFIDSRENPRSEFVFGPISFWWPRPWKGWVRVLASPCGLIGIIVTLRLLF